MYEVNKDLMQAIFSYLVSRPYAEVYQLIEAIKVLKRVDTPEGVTSEVSQTVNN